MAQKMNGRQKQFFRNLEQMLAEYENGRYDEPDVYVDLTADQWIEYIFPLIYHQRTDNYRTVYGTNVCGNLKFLGNEWMHEQLINRVREEGWLVEDE